MSEPILDFINRRFKEDCHWTTGNCYWFAAILVLRFPSLRMWYFPIENHWMAGDREGNTFYDWEGAKGKSELTEKAVRWPEEIDDSLLLSRLLKDCIF